MNVWGGDVVLMLQTKVEAISMHYHYLLTSQLESQRHYFEEKVFKLRALTDASACGRSKIVRRKGLMSQLLLTCPQLLMIEKLQKDADTLEKEKKAEEKKRVVVEMTARSLHSKLSKVEEEKAFLEQVHVLLTESQKAQLRGVYASGREEWDRAAKTALAAADGEKASLQKRIQDLEEQLRDVMFYMDAQKSISQRSDAEDLQEGTMVITESPDAAKKSRRKSGGKR